MSLKAKLEELCRRTRAGWMANPDQVQVDARQEESLLGGGYYDRQILELVQNAADAALARETARIELRLTASHLYAANTGDPLSPDGLRALILGNVSPKGGDEIGRFGLGFRSLLRLGGAVDMVSAGIAFRFDPAWCAVEARRVAGLRADAEAPGMRLARPLDLATERKRDPILADLLEWADTVLRAELADPDAVAAMRRELERFPVEFLLFQRPDLAIEILRPEAEPRCLRRGRRGDLLLLVDDGKESAWQLFRKRFAVEDADAKRDAGRRQARPEVDIAWAVPAEVRDPRGGELWNAFPTHTPSVLPGILDTRWKLNSDRTALTGEAWNAALMRRAAELVLESLPAMAREEDPGRPLAVLPRQLERKDEPSAPLHEAIWGRILDVPFLASAAGRLHRPAELRRPPVDDVELLERWTRVAKGKVADRIVHASCFATRERASRLGLLANELQTPRSSGSTRGLRPMPMDQWLAAIATSEPAAGREAILIAGAVVAERPEWLTVRDVAIVPTATGELAEPANVIFPGAVARQVGMHVIHPDVAADEAVRSALARLGVDAADDSAWRRALEHAWLGSSEPEHFERGWELLGAAPAPVRANFSEANASSIRFKTGDGQWRPAEEALRIGSLIGEDEREANAAVAIDRSFAERYAAVLDQLGIGDLPREQWLSRSRSRAMDAFEKAADDYYRSNFRGYSRPSIGVLRIVESYRSPEGADYLDRLDGMACVRLTKILLERLEKSDPSPVRFGGVGSRSTESRYWPVPVPNPSAWKLWKHGTWSIEGRIVSLAASISVRRELVAMPELQGVVSLLPDDAPLVRHWVQGFPEFPASVEPVWKALLASRHTRAHLELVPLWIEAAARGHVPETIPDPVGEGEIELSSVLLAESDEDLALAEEAHLPAVLLPASTREIWRKKGAQDLSARIETRVQGEPSPPLPASEDVPGLVDYLAGPDPAVRMVDRIERRLGRAVSDPGVIVREPEIMVSRDWAERAAPSDVLRKKLDALARLTKFNKPLFEVLEAVDRSEAERRRAAVRAAPDLPSRLLAAAGKTEALRESLPEAARRALEYAVDAPTLAQLCLDIHGPGALRAIEAALSREGLAPPRRWGTDEARQFVQALGFPPSFAGAANPRPPAELLVQGPRPLPPLHAFQKSVLAELKALVESGQPRRRAVLSLPTGSGKTRVAVEAAVRLALRGELGRPLLLWVAQTEELAEQAIEAFRHVWANEGLADRDLRIVRFFGGQRTPPDSAPDVPTVVVSLIQTMAARSDRVPAWFRSLAMLVIDESHHALAPSYTDLLRALGFAVGPRRKEDAREEPLLLGLTATPFRSSGEEESRLLAQRFDARVVPRDQAGLYERLRDQGFLSRVSMEPIAIEEPFQLEPEELKHLLQFDELPDGALQRLAGVTERNRTILEAVESAFERSILLFANSVEHAEELAARLSLRGIRSRVVSGQTDRSARRDAVTAFRRGEVRVITNAQLFSTGFDAPGVEMVLIARPVFSPVRFMQMVGRGLRGPANGGTPNCRVVTVRDNIVGYSGVHPLDWWRHHYE